MREGLKEPETPEILHGKQAWDLIQARLKDAWEDMILGPIEHVQGMVDDLRHAKDDYEIGKIVGEQAPQILLRLAINRFRKYHPLDKHYAVERYKKNPDHGYIPHPKKLEAFPDAKEVKRKNSVQGGGHLRKRWEEPKGDIYEWDSQHGTVEKYNKRGKHLGEFDHKNGMQLKPADPMRKIK